MAIGNPQQLNTADAVTLRPKLVERCTYLVSNFALYIIGGGKNADPNVANLKQWATNAIKNASQVADQVSWYVINQTSYLNGGTSIDDNELKGIVENAITANFVTPLT